MYDRFFSKIVSFKDCKVIFIHLFDAVVLRDATLEQLRRLWAKQMIRELGIDLTINELYLIRKECEEFLREKSGVEKNNTPYEEVVNEVYTRLICTNALSRADRYTFNNCFENSDYHSEILVQKPNNEIIELLKKLKNEGYRLFGTADTIGSFKLLDRCLKHHGLATLFENVMVASEHGHSFHGTALYQKTLNALDLEPKKAVVIGHDKKTFEDNEIQFLSIGQKNDVSNVTLSDQKKYRKIVRKLYRKCNRKPAPPHSDYILFYYVYIERLYKKAKKDNIRNICFLAREGLFLKRLFDHYQNEVSINKDDIINAHYFKAQ